MKSSTVVDEAPARVPAFDLPSQPAVFAPDYAPQEIAEIAAKLRSKAGLPKTATGEVANGKRTARQAASGGQAKTRSQEAGHA